jgi:GNAT superfamily N-acetyltransferase
MTWTTRDDTGAQVTVRPANEARWGDLETVFGRRGQWFKVRDFQWKGITPEDRADRLRTQTNCDDPDARATTGLVAYLGDEPVGWCAVEPRTAYPRLLRMRVPWTDRDEDRTDDSVWAVTCFVVRVGYRRRGISRSLAGAAVAYARERGARSLEGYSMLVVPGREVVWGELYVGNRTIFEDAGFHEVSRTTRRAVMRIDFDENAGRGGAGRAGQAGT